jgi:phospholipase/lecithinase/hemolysin
VSTQVQNYLAQFSAVPPATTPFSAQQLVAVLAGNNDIFMALSSVNTNIAKGMTQSAAVATAQAAVGQAADDLTSQIKTILGNGGKYVLVYTLPDTSVTPFGRALPFTYGLAYNQTAAAAGNYSLSGPPPGYTCNNTDTHTPCYLLSNLVQIFNQRLLNDLQGRPVKIVDGYGLFNQLLTSPTFSNVTSSACDLTKVPSSLLCNNGTLNSDVTNVGSWLFADSVHPTPAGYKAIADATQQSMASFGWISQ